MTLNKLNKYSIYKLNWHYLLIKGIDAAYGFLSIQLYVNGKNIYLNILRNIIFCVPYLTYFFVFQVLHIWNDMRVSKWWQNVYCWVNYLFKLESHLSF